MVAGTPPPAMAVWVVSEVSIVGSCRLVVALTSGRVIFNQSWPVDVTVAPNDMGAAVKLDGSVGWAAPAADLAGEVVLFRLLLHPSAADRSVAMAPIAEQLYTFGILKPGSSVHEPMDAIKPMAPLLSADQAKCEILEATCDPSRQCTATVVNPTGSGPPCLYVRLALRDPIGPAGMPQFNAASFSNNYFTVFDGERIVVSFRSLTFKRESFKVENGGAMSDATGDGGKRQLCLTGWNLLGSSCVDMVSTTGRTI